MHKGKKILALFMTILSAIALVAFFILPVYDNRSYLSCLLDMIDKLREVLHQTISFSSIISEFIIFVLLTILPFLMFFIFARSFVSIFVRNAKCKIYGKCSLLLIIQALFLYTSFYYKDTNFPQWYVDFISNSQILSSLVDELISNQINIGFFIFLAVVIIDIILEIFRRVNIKSNPDDRPIEAISLSRFNNISSNGQAKATRYHQNIK